MKILLPLILAFSMNCGDRITNNITQPTPLPDKPTTPVVVENRISFRVTGTPTSVRIRHTNPVDGTNQVITSLPFNASFVTTQSTLFVSLEATPLVYPSFLNPNFISVQIFGNDILFREAASTESFGAMISVSGNWRK